MSILFYIFRLFRNPIHTKILIRPSHQTHIQLGKSQGKTPIQAYVGLIMGCSPTTLIFTYKNFVKLFNHIFTLR